MKQLIILGLCSSIFFACKGPKKYTPNPSTTTLKVKETAPKADIGLVLYKKHCKLCHGSKGTLGFSGAANLKKSVLPKSEAIGIITNGKNNMTAFSSKLSTEEIELVATYIQTLKRP